MHKILLQIAKVGIKTQPAPQPDEASLLVGTVVSPLPTPVPVTQPDFKAGKDQ